MAILGCHHPQLHSSGAYAGETINSTLEHGVGRTVLYFEDYFKVGQTVHPSENGSKRDNCRRDLGFHETVNLGSGSFYVLLFSSANSCPSPVPQSIKSGIYYEHVRVETNPYTFTGPSTIAKRNRRTLMNR
jgi:hypothetical protein